MNLANNVVEIWHRSNLASVFGPQDAEAAPDA